MPYYRTQKRRCYVLVSKNGLGSETSGGRFFQYYDELTVQQLYESDSRLGVFKTWKNKPIDPSDPQQREWLNLLLCRGPWYIPTGATYKAVRAKVIPQ